VLVGVGCVVDSKLSQIVSLCWEKMSLTSANNCFEVLYVGLFLSRMDFLAGFFNEPPVKVLVHTHIIGLCSVLELPRLFLAP
jgi:hypothetical protein